MIRIPQLETNGKNNIDSNTLKISFYGFIYLLRSFTNGKSKLNLLFLYFCRCGCCCTGWLPIRDWWLRWNFSFGISGEVWSEIKPVDICSFHGNQKETSWSCCFPRFNICRSDIFTQIIWDALHDLLPFVQF